MIQSTTQSHHSSLNLNNFQSFDLLSKHLKASKDQPILSPNKSFVKRQLKGSNSDEEIESNYSEFEDEGILTLFINLIIISIYIKEFQNKFSYNLLITLI